MVGGMPAGILTTSIDQALAVLDGSPAVHKRYEQDRRWLIDRRSVWAAATWRVGLIGVTSSGKSTLVNALLGESLLPAKVRPSSNTLVVCTHGATRGGTVYYESKPEEDVPYIRLEQRLSELADEGRNPHNKLGVKEIHVRSAQFRLGASVALVDSPGLDAHGHEAHEDLTLKLLLPTVDLAVFVTTAKANADNQMRHYLGTISSARKQMIVVQNMIDTVVAKHGPGGIELKSKAQVAEEHMKRVRRILLESADPVIESAPVIQVSAREALNGGLKASNLERLVKVVQAHLRGIAPKLEAARVRQLQDHLTRIMSQETSTDADREREQNAENQKLGELRGAVRALVSSIRKTSDELLGTAEKEARSLLQRVQAHSGSNEGADSIQRDVKEWQITLGKRVNGIFDQLLAGVRLIAKDLNLRAEDYAMSRPNQDRISLSVEVDSTPEVHHYTRKKSGFWSSVARTFGLGGYEECSGTIYTYSVRNAPQVIVAEAHWLDGALIRLQDAANDYTSRLEVELSRRERAIAERRQNTITASERSAIRGRLGGLVKALASEVARMVPESAVAPVDAVVREDSEVCTAPLFAVKLCELVNLMAAKRCSMFRDMVLARVAPAEARSRVLFAGWDGEALDLFKDQFLMDARLPNLSSSSSGYVQGKLPFLEFLFADHTKANDADLKRLLGSAVTRPAIALIMLDLHQPGSTRKQLHKSILFRHLHQFSGIVLVVQSVTALWHVPSEFTDALVELRTLINELPKKPVGMLVNHPDVRISALVDTLLCGGESFPTLAAEIQKLQELGFHEGSQAGTNFTDAGTNFAAEVLRKWRSQANPMS